MSFSSSRRVFGGPNTLPSSQQTINRDRYDSTGNGNNGRLGGGLFDEPEAGHQTHFGREGPIREEQIYGNESEGITRPDCGPPPRRNLGHGVYNGNQQQMGRLRRAKYFPPQKEDVDLFDEERQIQKGPQFDAQYGEQRDDEIVVVPTFNHLIKSFEECNFSREILNNIKLSKYTDPTPIQKAVIPLISHTTKDIMGNAQTGSGKTAAFLLPIISWIQIKVARSRSHAINRDSPYCVVLEPTKELAEQIFEDARKLATNTNVSIARSYGDMPMKSCLQAMERGCDILVITSGRLSHHIFASHIKLSNLRFFVMDEADKLIRDKFFNEAAHELVYHREIHPEYRVLLFSATFSTEVQDKSQEFIRPDRYFVRVGNMNRAAETIEQFFLEVEHPEKADKLLEILQENAVQKKLPDGRSISVPAKKTIIFVAEKRRADYLAIFLNSKSFLVMSLNSDRSLEQRLRTFDDFKRDKNMILVTTDVAARGVNMPGVEHVINFNLPHWDDEQDSYIHRIGRTGRAGNVGMATSFFDPTDFNDIRNVNYYIKNLQKGQEMPEVLRKYHVEQLNNTREQFYEEGRVPGEQQDAWGNTNAANECRPVLNEPMTSSSSKSGANHFQQSNEVPRYTGINNTKQQQFNNPTIFGRNQQTVRTNNAYPYANENLPSHLGATLDNAHGTESSFIDDFDDKW